VFNTARMPCDLCGSQTWDGDAHFALGKLWCPECWAGQRPAASMVPNAHEQLALADWIAPHRGAQP
jgi:hypothetical protein